MLMAPLIFWSLHWISRLTNNPYLPSERRASMNMRRAKPTLRIQFLGLCMLVGLGALLLRLWWVQVARGYEWTARIQSSSGSDRAHPVDPRRDSRSQRRRPGAESRQLRGRFLSAGDGERLSAALRPPARDAVPRDDQRHAERYERAGHRPDRQRRRRPAARGSRSGARLQREPAAEALPQQHRGPLFLHQGHRLRDDGEVFRTRCRACRASISRSSRCAPTFTARSPPTC